MLEVQPPRAVNRPLVFSFLLIGQFWTTLGTPVWSDGHDVCCSVRKPDSGTRKCHLHHVSGKVAGRMQHILVCGGYVTGSCIVVGPKVSGGAPASSSLEQKREVDSSFVVDD
jgi:hypothetical protein